MPNLRKVTYYKMPLAIGFGSSSTNWKTLVRNHKTFAYWYVPDTAFVSMDMGTQVFPPYKPDERGAGKLVSAFLGPPVYNQSKDLP